MAILDQFGRPIVKEALREPQTARVGWLQQTFAQHPSRGLTPQKLARILEDAEHGDLVAQFDLFEDMEEKDGHILAEMSTRKRALLGLDWDLLPPRNASAAEVRGTEAVKELLLGMENIEDLILDLADAIGKGFACVELEWLRLGQTWTIAHARHRPQQWFQLDPATRTEIRLRESSAEGEPLQPFGWIVHVHKARSGYLARAGLHRVLSWPFLFKNYAVRDCAEFVEIYGLPVRVGRYPSGASDAEKRTLLSAVMGIGHSAAGIIPETMALEFLEAAKGTHEPFAFIIDWAERTQSKCIVGQTLSAESKATGLGSGVADLHGSVRQDIIEADAMQIAGDLTRHLVYPLAALNAGVGNPGRSPRWSFDTRQAADLKVLGESLKTIVDMGMRVPQSYVYERAKIPQPTDAEPVLERAPSAPAMASLAAASDARLAPTGGFPDQRAVDAAADALPDAELQRQAEAMLAPVMDLIREGASYEQIGQRLGEVYPRMNAARLEALLARAIFAMDVWGRISAGEDE